MSKNNDFIMWFPPPLANAPITMYYIPNCKACEDAAAFFRTYRNPKTNQPILATIYNAGKIGQLLEEANPESSLSGKALFMKNIHKYTKSKHMTFPMIFKGDGKKIEFIGGWDTFKQLHRI